MARLGCASLHGALQFLPRLPLLFLASPLSRSHPARRLQLPSPCLRLFTSLGILLLGEHGCWPELQGGALALAGVYFVESTGTP